MSNTGATSSFDAPIHRTGVFLFPTTKKWLKELFGRSFGRLDLQ